MQILCRSREKACLFTFFLYERTLLENCIRHSSKCTNGYFLSYITLTSMFGTQLERRICLWINTTYWGRPHSQPVCCDQCTFHTFDPKLHFSFCWMDKITSKLHDIFLIYIWIRKPRFWAFTMFGEWTVYKQIVLLQVVLRIVACFFSPFPTFFFSCVSLPAWQKNGWTTAPSLSFCLALQRREAE